MKHFNDGSKKSVRNNWLVEEIERRYKELTNDKTGCAAKLLLELSEEELASTYQPGRTETEYYLS